MLHYEYAMFGVITIKSWNKHCVFEQLVKGVSYFCIFQSGVKITCNIEKVKLGKILQCMQ